MICCIYQFSWRKFGLCIGLVSFLTLQLYSQENPAFFELQTDILANKGTIVLGEEPWRYHPGDDLAWADPNLDDTGWELLKPNFDLDSVGTGTWNGIGWFRIKLIIDSALHNTTLALHPFHQGASEIFLDGKYVGGYGKVGGNHSTINYFNPKGLPIGLHLGAKDTLLLTVRYAHDQETMISKAMDSHPRHPRGFFFLVKPINTGIRAFVYRTLEVPFTLGLSMGILGLLGILHLFLFLMDRKERANLYFFVLAISGSIAIHIVAAYDSPALLIPDMLARARIGYFSRLTMEMAIMAVYYQIFYRRLLPSFWILTCFTLILITLSFWTTLPILFGEIIFLIVILECVRVTAVAIWRKKEGGWIFAAAIILMIATLVLIIQIQKEYLNPSQDGLLNPLDGLQLVTLFSVCIMILYLAVPLAMSGHLIMQFDQTRRKLRRKLDELQILSEKAITQEREKQELIASQNERLEKKVAQRTEELEISLADLKSTQEQLIHSEKMASLGQLTAGIAHEIKNPLNFITNFSEMNEELLEELKETLEQEPEKAPEVIISLLEGSKIISKHGKRADQIVRSMMQHASGGSGEREETDVNALLDEYVNLAYHSKRAHQKGFQAEVVRKYDNNVGLVKLVPQDMGRVFLNLLNNAFDAVEGQKNPIVKITTVDQGDHITIHISDNGPGVPIESRDKIFEPFFTTKKTGSGTGLGLSMSYDIITSVYRGSISVLGAPGEGAAFVVTLPRQ